jgi:hypothetical protein
MVARSGNNWKPGWQMSNDQDTCTILWDTNLDDWFVETDYRLLITDGLPTTD